MATCYPQGVPLPRDGIMFDEKMQRTPGEQTQMTWEPYPENRVPVFYYYYSNGFDVRPPGQRERHARPGLCHWHDV